MAISNWRTSKDAQHATGLIGPNAILQLVPILDQALGQDRRAHLMSAAGLAKLPDGSSMIPQAQAARLHRQLRLKEPARASALAAAAGVATADYILANRIPQSAQWVLKRLPKGASARLLSHAISKHAWTFAGSGHFTAQSPWRFEIENNPLVAGEASDTCLCHWHAAVFEQLYRVLVAPTCHCVETRCAAQTRGHLCCFELQS